MRRTEIRFNSDLNSNFIEHDMLLRVMTEKINVLINSKLIYYITEVHYNNSPWGIDLVNFSLQKNFINPDYLIFNRFSINDLFNPNLYDILVDLTEEDGSWYIRRVEFRELRDERNFIILERFETRFGNYIPSYEERAAFGEALGDLIKKNLKWRTDFYLENWIALNPTMDSEIARHNIEYYDDFPMEEDSAFNKFLIGRLVYDIIKIELNETFLWKK